MGKIDKYIEALETLGDGRYHYYDGKAMGIGCSEYTRLALLMAGIIEPEESFHAASGDPGPLEDTSRFQKIPWDPANLQRGDIMWSNYYHVATWSEKKKGVYEAAPRTHGTGICDNGKSGVGHWSNHTYYNCGTCTYAWSCIYRIIDTDEITETAKEVIQVDKSKNLSALIEYLPEIKYGSKSNTVKALQIMLKKYGWYSDVIDGKAGPNTVKGIKLMQTALGLDADGVVNRDTWTKILI